MSRWVSFKILPIVRYTGQALLLPWNWESLVLSEDRITGTMVTPGGRYFCINQWVRSRLWMAMTKLTDLKLPPPWTHPHLIDNLHRTLAIHQELLRHILHYIAKHWISQELPNTINRITIPQLKSFSLELAIDVKPVSCEFNLFKLPVCPSSKLINDIQVFLFIAKGWLGSILDLIDWVSLFELIVNIWVWLTIFNHRNLSMALWPTCLINHLANSHSSSSLNGPKIS